MIYESFYGEMVWPIASYMPSYQVTLATLSGCASVLKTYWLCPDESTCHSASCLLSACFSFCTVVLSESL